MLFTLGFSAGFLGIQASWLSGSTEFGVQFLLLSGFGSVSISPEKRLLDSDSAYCVGMGSLRRWDIRVPNKYQYYYSGLLLTHGPHGSSFLGFMFKIL